MLMSMVMTEGLGYAIGNDTMGRCLDFIDVKRAYFYADSKLMVYVDLPPEDYEDGKCVNLLKSMYGTRDAAQNWEMEYTGFMTNSGFNQGRASPCVFFHQERGIRVTVHVDDFTVLVDRKELDWFRMKMQRKYSVKSRGRRGPGKDDDKSIRILNRIVEWRKDEIRYEVDQRHAEMIIKHLGLNQGKTNSVVTPGQKRVSKDEDE